MLSFVSSWPSLILSLQKVLHMVSSSSGVILKLLVILNWKSNISKLRLILVSLANPLVQSCNEDGYSVSLQMSQLLFFHEFYENLY